MTMSCQKLTKGTLYTYKQVLHHFFFSDQRWKLLLHQSAIICTNAQLQKKFDIVIAICNVIYT